MWLQLKKLQEKKKLQQLTISNEPTDIVRQYKYFEVCDQISYVNYLVLIDLEPIKAINIFYAWQTVDQAKSLNSYTD